MYTGYFRPGIQSQLAERPAYLTGPIPLGFLSAPRSPHSSWPLDVVWHVVVNQHLPSGQPTLIQCHACTHAHTCTCTVAFCVSFNNIHHQPIQLQNFQYWYTRAHTSSLPLHAPTASVKETWTQRERNKREAMCVWFRTFMRIL